jgi:outer membrane protein TolC
MRLALATMCFVFVCVRGWTAGAQDIPPINPGGGLPAGGGMSGGGTPSGDPRLQLPFGVNPEQVTGPPRAMGELPSGFGQPPSDNPGRLPGPARADGMSPLSLNPLGPLSTQPGSSPLSPLSPLLNLPEGGPAGLGPLVPNSEMSDIDRMGPMISPRGGAGRELRAPADARPLPDLPALKIDDSPFLPRTPSSARKRVAPLPLSEVLISAERTYPPFLAYLQERQAAYGEFLSAQGSFDLSLSSDARNWGLGYYQRYLYDVFFEQPTQIWGAKFFAGYRLSAGDWPVYYQYLQTNTAGAYVAGVDLPLLRNGRIDAKRAKLYQTELERRKVEPAISKQRITLLKDAAKLYWNWVAAGQAYEVVSKLVTVAEQRNDAIRRAVELGSLAPAEIVDNQRVLLSRQNSLLAARRRLQTAAIELSLFYRDPTSLPALVEPERLPEGFPTIIRPDIARLDEDLEVALRLRPEVRVLAIQGMKVEIDRQLAENQRLPGLNLYIYSEQNTGAPIPLKNKSPFILESSLLFEVPLQRRFARGREIVAQAGLRQIRFQQQFAQDRIIADVKDAAAGLQVAYESYDRYRQAVALNRQLEEAENRKFAGGASNVLFLNLREQATAESELLAFDSAAKYFSSVADYRAALGVDALPPSPPR